MTNLLDRIFEVDEAGYLHFDDDGEESEDVMDLDNTPIRDYLDDNVVDGDRLLGQRLRAEELDVGFYEDFEQRLQDLEDLEKEQEAEAELSDAEIDAIIAEEAKGG